MAVPTMKMRVRFHEESARDYNDVVGWSLVEDGKFLRIDHKDGSQAYINVEKTEAFYIDPTTNP